MNTVRFEPHAIRARSASPRIDPRLRMLVAGMIVVFACFFAVGRATDTSSPRAEALSSLTTTFSSVAIPLHLSGAPPIEISIAVRAHARATGRSRPIPIETASAPAQAAAHEVSPAPLRSSPSAQPVSPQPEKVSPSPAHVSPPSTNGSSGSGGGHSKPSATGGGSFDSSG